MESIPNTESLFAVHARSFGANRYVYPVLSRRSGGISIGINLNLDKICNFDCIYCQVDRTQMGPKQKVDVPRLVDELERMVALVVSGRIYEETKFCDTPAHLRRLNDIALSGDGEPTTYPNFPEIVTACAEVRRRHGLHDVKLVLITNATMFHREKVRRGLAILDANHGEIWAKLDAGTAAYYREVDRTTIPFQQILDNLLDAARTRPILVQSLFMRVRGVATPLAEQTAYCQRLCEIVAAGGKIQQVQIHTVARQPAESWVTPLSNEEVDGLANIVRQQTGLSVVTFYGV